MPRVKAIQQSEFPYNISARSINKEWFSLPMEDVWEIMCSELFDTIKECNLEVHSFVLMSNHFHLIASTPDANISQCMHRFMYRSSRRLTRAGNRINETYAGRHYKCILQHPNYFLNAYKYNYRNPVTAKICQKVEEYPFSTLPWVIGRDRKRFHLCEDTTFESDPLGTLTWLNTAPDQKKQEAYRSGIKHQYFKSANNKSSHKPILSSEDRL